MLTLRVIFQSQHAAGRGIGGVGRAGACNAKWSVQAPWWPQYRAENGGGN